MKKFFTAAAFALGLIASRADTTLVFNEIMYHPNVGTNEASYEWVEIYNQLAVDLDVSGWRIKGDINFTFPNNLRIPGRGFLVLAADPVKLLASNPTAKNLLGALTNRLSNGGGTIRIVNNADRLVDEVTYGTDGDWPVGPDGSGVSLAKIDRDTASSKAANWTASRQVGGTPGYENFALVTNVTLVPIAAGWRFNDSGTDLTGTGWQNLSYNDAAWASRHNLTNRSIPTLFNTGVGTNGTVQGPNTLDPHFTITAAAQGPVNTNATVILNHPNWLANNASSTFIGVLDPGASSVAAGGYNYQTTFSLAGFIPSTVQINVSVAVDNQVTNAYLNGTPVNFNVTGFASMTPAGVLSSGFNANQNTLEFRTWNYDGPGANPHGFRAEFTSTALAVNTNTPPTFGRTTYYYRRAFVFNGDPAYALLTLNTIAADGAVYYLNGVEVHRQNMPAGAVDYSTRPLSDVSLLAYSNAISISASNLVTGTNVLAVEVHQAIASNDGPVLGAELRYAELSRPALSLLFNELPGTNANPYWIEFRNAGSVTDLSGAVLVHDGASTRHEYVFPPGTSLPQGSLLVVTNPTLGFVPVPGDRLFIYSSNRLALSDAVVVKKGPRARFQDGEWWVPNVLTPGASNSFIVNDQVVINEIMFNHHPTAFANGLPIENDEQWIELYNRGSNAVDLTGWELDNAVSFQFPVGKTIAPGAYLVVAKDALALRASYPLIDIVGDFNGKLSHNEERVTLKDALGNRANSVHYYTDGRWPEYPDGDGSSLELRDPLADNSQPEAWAASDETSKMGWQTYTYTMVAAASVTPRPETSGSVAGYVAWREFVLGMVAGGECLIDDISVVQSPGSSPVQMIDNGNFEGGITGWRPLGNHRLSQVESEPGNPGNHVLHVYASGPQEHMHNHIETTLSSGRSVANGQTYQITYRAKWLGGGNLLNTRLYFNRCARTTTLPMPALTGTPGARNSVYATNIGPTFSAFSHSPVIPSASAPVTVRVQANDPQSVTNVTLWWSANGGAWSSTAMTNDQGFSATIPQLSAGTLVQFFVRAVDGLGAVSTFPAKGSNSAAFYRVDDGLANVTLQHNMRILMSPANTALLHASTNVMSNETLPCTVIYDERIVYYDARVRLKSSERGRDVAARVGFHLEFAPDQLFRGVHPVLLVDRSGGGSRPAQEEVLLKHMAQRAGLHIPNSDVMRILAPQSAQNGAAIVAPRFEDEFLDASFSNGGDGTLWELELIYYPTTANAAGYKLPQPDDVNGLDVSDVGNDKETYRYNFIIKNHRGADNYAPFMNLAKVWSNTNLTLLDLQTHMTMDINEWMRTYALVSLCGVGDMYTFGNNHNFMFYMRPSDSQFLYLPWDMDFSFSQSATAALVGNTPANNLTRIISLTPNLRRLYAHMLDQIATVYNTSYMTYWVSHYGPFSGQDYSADLAYIQQRGDFAKTTINTAGGNAAFAVTGTNFIVTSNNVIVLSGTAPVTATSLRVNGNEYPITWTSISAWTMTVPVSAASNFLNIAGYDLRGATVSNITRTVIYSNTIPSPVGNVMFSEIMFNPAVPNGEYIELFNASSNFVFDLSGWRINGLDFTFPSGTIISNRQFIIVCANEPAYLAAYGSAAGIPVGEFGGALQNDGETLTLIKPGATPAQDVVVDRVRYEGGLPWPKGVVGAGVQLVDNTQDNVRAANWTSSYSPAQTNDGWRFVSRTGNFGTSDKLIIYPDAAGTVWLDDFALVQGSNAAVGFNYIRGGDFDDAAILTNSSIWGLGTNMNGSYITNDSVRPGGGSTSFRLIAGVPGSPSLTNRDIVHALSSPLPPQNTPCTLSFWYYATNTAIQTLTVRILGSTLIATNISVFTIPATNVNTPGQSNFGVATLPAFQPLWINELQAENVSGVIDNFGEREPWIEIYNASTNSVSLAGLYLSTNYNNLTAYALPAATLAPGEFRIIWCDGQTNQTADTNLHTSFRLSSGAGSLALSRLNNGQPQVLDYVNYNGLHADRSYGSFPDGQPFDRQEFFYVTAGGTNNGSSAPITVFINEWMASNVGTLADEDTNYEDWFELYNPTTNAVNLAGYYLTDSSTNGAGVITNKFQFHITTNMAHIIPPLGYLLVWADNEAAQNVGPTGVISADLHVSFALSKSGDAIGFFAADGTMIDYVTFGAQVDDVSRGRYPDGGPSIINFPETVSPRAANYLNGVANTPPALAAIGNQFVYLGNALAFNASATDTDAPPQSLTFTLGPGAPPNAAISPAGAFTWTPNAIGSFPVTVRVTDNGTPPLSASEAITIDVLAAPQFTGLTRNGANLELTWGARSNQTYRIEYKDDLNAPDWQLLRTVTAMSGTVSITNSTVSPDARFYRIVVQ